jgi:hypothetical protein
MPFPLHTVEAQDGTAIAYSDKIFYGALFGIANAAGASAGAAVSTPVVWPSPGVLPANYFVDVETSAANVQVSVQSKTSAGFDVVLTPIPTVTGSTPANSTVAAGSFNVRVTA